MIEIKELQTISIKPNDTVVCSIDLFLTMAQKAEVAAELKKVFPNNVCLVLDKNAKIEVTREDK